MRMHRSNLASLSAVVLLAGCGPDGVRFKNQAHAGPTFGGMGPDAPTWIRDSDLESRALATAHAAADVWNRELHGVVIHLVNDITNCGRGRIACTTVTGSDLTFNREVHIWLTPVSREQPTDPWTGVPASCIEATALAHEIGHVTNGDMDGDHSDPRWCDPSFWRAMASAIVPLHPEFETEIRAVLATEMNHCSGE